MHFSIAVLAHTLIQLCNSAIPLMCVCVCDLNVLREPWRTYGFANRDFSFDRYGMYYDRKCLISVPLPEYEITGISTGQYAGDNRIWQVQFAP